MALSHWNKIQLNFKTTSHHPQSLGELENSERSFIQIWFLKNIFAVEFCWEYSDGEELIEKQMETLACYFQRQIRWLTKAHELLNRKIDGNLLLHDIKISKANISDILPNWVSVFGLCLQHKLWVILYFSVCPAFTASPSESHGIGVIQQNKSGIQAGHLCVEKKGIHTDSVIHLYTYMHIHMHMHMNIGICILTC